ncbi:tRNA lysidine(34) synthetase TilS [Devosia sp.]|uniref:tRNA lysidine(34) synthetase TilS n=1 Tax=Devosia sp. TaxID=1871048 RepID=UPI003A94215B
MPGRLTQVAAALDEVTLGRGAALAVSGGTDSLALLELTRQAAARTGRYDAITVYAVDHGLRPEAADEAAFVLDTARRMGFAARGLRWEGAKPETGIQAAARAARYRLFAAAMAEDGAGQLLTAHHRDDQAETVLMRLAHGSGLTGLSGIHTHATVDGCAIYRPLLGLGRADLAAVVAAAGLTPVDDPSNADPSYERVRWRQFQPQLDSMRLTAERLATLAERLSDATALIAETVDSEFSRLVNLGEDGRVEMSQAAFAALNPLVGAGLIERALKQVAADDGRVPLAPLELLAARLAHEEPFKAVTLHGCAISCRKGRIVIGAEPQRRSAVVPGSADGARETELT